MVADDLPAAALAGAEDRGQELDRRLAAVERFDERLTAATGVLIAGGALLATGLLLRALTRRSGSPAAADLTGGAS